MTTDREKMLAHQKKRKHTTTIIEARSSPIREITIRKGFTIKVRRTTKTITTVTEV